MRAFNGSGVDSGGVQQPDLDLMGHLQGLRGQLGPGLVRTCSLLGPGAGVGGPEGDDRNGDMKDDMAMSLFVSRLLPSASRLLPRLLLRAG